MTENLWAFNCPFGCPSIRLNSAINPYIKTEFTSIKDAVGNYALTTIKDYTYDKNGNVTQVKEYDWMPYGSVPRDQYGQITGIPTGITPKRITASGYYAETPAAGTTTTNGNLYVWTNSPQLKQTAAWMEIRNGSGTAVSRAEMNYDNASMTGNLTQTKVWDSAKGAYSNPLIPGNSISTTAVYNPYGMPISTTDEKGNQTQITYGAIIGPNGAVSDLYPTQVVSAYGTGIQQTAQTEYDFYTGLPKKVTALGNTTNENVVSETVYDAAGRPLIAKTAVGTANEIWTQSEYNDQLRRIITRADLFGTGDGKKIGVQHFDQLGRVRLSRRIEDVATQNPTNEADGIKMQTRYLMGNPNSYQLVSNPYRAATAAQATGEASMGWTRSMSVNTGKHAETETFSGASLPAPWGNNTNSTGIVSTDIDADRTLVSDQAGKRRISKTNALGQLTDIWEITASDTATVAVTFPNQPITAGYQTSYQYDTLNNLKKVIQGTQANRNFTYSSLSRLLSAQNPESGTITYGYDAGGNVTQKTDARNVQTNYSYDNLNRVTTRSYTDGITSAVSYFYDNLPNAKGKLIKVSSSVSTTEYTSFDILGRVLAHKQTTDGNAYTTAYSYNLSGALIEETYPSGRVVKNVLDNDGDLSIVQSKKNQNSGFFNYAKNFTYTAAGAVSSMQLGNGKWESTQFNSRLQPTQIALGTVQNGTDKLKLNFDYGLTDNNGNVKSQQITVPTVGANQGFTAVQNYTYDSLNRLKSATETIGSQTWKQTFTFDRYGNRRFDTANTTTLGSCPQAQCNPTIDTANNRFTTGQGYTFDLAGNLITDATGRSFIYDAENKQKEVKDINNISVGQYFYDGDGKRVKKFIYTTQETTLFVYDASGKMVAEYSTQANNNPQVSYLTNDHLGSPRITTDANGNTISRRDYLPFGEDLITSQRMPGLNYTTDNIRRKFTTYKRDDETGLDFAEARYYSSRWGRFVSPDEFTGGPDELFDFADDAADNPTFYADLTNPQSLNKYQYTYNNPLNMTDSDGHDPCCPPMPAQTMPLPVPWLWDLVLPKTPILAPPVPIIVTPDGRSIPRSQTYEDELGNVYDTSGNMIQRAPRTAVGGSGRAEATVRPRSNAQPNARPKPIEAHKPTKQSTGSKKKNNDRHTDGEARNKKEQQRAEEFKPKPKPKKPKRVPNTPHVNKYPPKTGPNAIPKDPNLP